MAEGGLEGTLESLPGGDTKIGGKSVYLYGLVIAVVVVVYLWWAGRNSVPAAAPVDDFSGLPNVSGDLGDLPAAAQPNDLVDETTFTNAYWAAKAVAWLVTQGVAPLSAQRAIERYLGGESLDYNQTVIVNKAVGEFGVPPESLLSSPDIQDAPPVAAKPVWKAQTSKWQTVGNTPTYRKAEDYPAKRYYSLPAGKIITTVQTTNYGGATLVRALNGTVISASDLTPYVEPVKVEPKKDDDD